MKHSFASAMRWTLHSLLLLLTFLIQSVVLGDLTVSVAKFSLIPVATAAVSARLRHEQAGIFALAVSLFWALTGQESGPVYLMLLPIGCILSAWVCTHYLRRNIGSALLAALFCMLLCEGGVLLQQLYMQGDVSEQSTLALGLQLLISVPMVLIFWPLVGRIERVKST